MFSKATTSYPLLRDIMLAPLQDAAAPKFPARALWQTQPTLVHVVRRPGCTFCREEASRLEDQRAKIEGYGVRMVAVVKEPLGAAEFAEKFTRSPVYLDTDMGFYKALGGGEVSKASFLTFLRPAFWSNYSRNKESGSVGNLEGEGMIKGGLFVIGKGDSGAVYAFQEQVIGAALPMEEIVEACEAAGKADASGP